MAAGPLRLWAVMQLSGLVPDVVTYNAAVSAYEKSAQGQQVMQLSGLSCPMSSLTMQP
jgi:hypothetical protein